MTKMEICNAVVKSVSLSNADHGCLSAWVHLDYGGSGQGFGGHALYVKGNAMPNYTGAFIDEVLRIAGVSEWDRVPGKTLRVEITNGLVSGIGHIINDDWFRPGEMFKKMADDHA